MGQVYGATAIAYDPALTVREYIDRAGGLTADADKDQIFVVKANGAVLSAASFSDMGSNHIFPLLPLISGGFMTARLEPGDTVYVPASFLFVNPLRRTLDITQIIANTAQGIAYAALLGSML
jgi:protein involved in polysaccharide export with SLBB domain